MLAGSGTVAGRDLAEGLSPVFSTSYFQIRFEGISASINQTDYVMSLWTSSTPTETERIFKRILSYKLMDGALLLSAVEGDTLTRRLVERKVPTVMIGRCSLPEVLTVDVDNVAAARTATEHLIRLGATIGHIFRRRIFCQQVNDSGVPTGHEASGIGLRP
jgi:DNA-binding LacI/PurR family transcriptional regulator